MSSRTPLILIALAIAFAGAAAWGANTWLNSKARQKAAGRVKMASVVTAAVEVPAGRPLRASELMVKKWPAGNIPVGAISKKKPLVGRVLKVTVYKGEPILAAKVAPKGLSGGLSALVPAGYRAMTVKVDDVIGVGGFVQPGDRVDVLATVSVGPYREDPVTRLVLQDVKVLTVGGKVTEEKAAGPKRNRTSVVTLQLTPEQSETLALSAGEGKLLLSLRNQGDGIKEQTAGIRMTSLMPPPSSRKELMKGGGEALAAKEDPGIEVIKGVSRGLQSLKPKPDEGGRKRAANTPPRVGG